MAKVQDVEIELWQMRSKPIAVSGGAIYPYKDGWMEIGERKAKYPDENGNTTFNLFRTVGAAPHRRIWVPRNMVNPITPDIDQRVRGIDIQFESSFVARNKEQSRIIQEATTLLVGQDKSFMMRAPTGFGKTWCTTKIIANVGKKTIITVTKEDIVEQWVKALQACLGLSVTREIGFIAGDTCDTVNKAVVIAMVQSLAKEQRYPEHLFRDFGFALWDECHRIGADYFSQSCFRVPAFLRMGISATPRRKDGREEVLHAHIGPVRVSSNATPMTPRIIVQDSPWYCPQERRVDKAGRLIIDTKTGLPAMYPIAHSPAKCGQVIRMIVHSHPRNKVAINFIAQAYKAGRKIIFQSDQKEHLEMIASMLPMAGVPVQDIGFYVGGLKSKQREIAASKRVIGATYQMTAEATDIPELDTLVMLTPKADVEQIVGRILRYVEGKKEPVVFDLQDRSSPLFSSYADARLKWYKSIGATVKESKEPAPHIDKQGKSITIAATSKLQ
jgi:superfamily II DNA or RNA helicase